MHRISILLAMLAPAAASAAAGELVRVKITDLAFTPAEITVRVGDTVEWMNGDFIDHTATANSSIWDFIIPAGKSAQLKVNQAGSFEYFCRFHPTMTGMIRVSEH